MRKNTWEATDLSNFVVFDIETIPQAVGEYPASLEDVITRKLARKSDVVDVDSERRKIMATDPFLGKIICIGLYYPLSGTQLALTDDSEKNILSRFWKAMSDFNGVFVGYNTVRFDCPFIVKRSMLNEVQQTNSRFLQYTRYDPFPPHFDVMLQLSGRESYVSLKQACELFNIPSSKDGAVRAENVEQAYKEGRIKEIADYCLRDVVATYKLSKILYNYVAKN